MLRFRQNPGPGRVDWGYRQTAINTPVLSPRRLLYPIWSFWIKRYERYTGPSLVIEARLTRRCSLTWLPVSDPYRVGRIIYHF